MAPEAGSHDRLFVATAAYLLAPNVIFLLGWLSPAWGIPATVLVAACFADLWRRATTRSAPLGRSEWVFAATFALALTLVAGVGHVNLQVVDYVKHNLVFHDLVEHRWPVTYPNLGAGGSLLCYYTAYYLPASLAGKLFGLAWTEPASLLWALAGVTLALAWVVRLGRPAGRAVLAVFVFVDGFAWVPGLYAAAQRFGLLPGGVRGPWWETGGFTENFARFGKPPVFLLFESEPWHLLWVPQHTIAAWLVTVCILRVLDEGESPRHLGLVAAAVLLWSPFVAVGVLPFLAMAALRGRREALAWPGVAGGLALAVPVGLYILGHSSYQNLGLLPARFSGPWDWLRYAVFLAGSVGVLAAAVALVRRRFGTPAGREWRTFLVAASWLVLTTVIVMGYYDDWVMRVSMPALVVFRLTVARLVIELWRRGGALLPRLAFAAVVLLSAERPLKTTVLAAAGRLQTQQDGTTIATATRAAPSLGELRGGSGWEYGAQYLGPTTSWFGRHMAKPEP